MARPVRCSIVDMPDGRFAVVAASASGKVFRRAGLLTRAQAEECVDLLRALMAACGAAVVEVPPFRPLGAASPSTAGPDRPFAKAASRVPCRDIGFPVPTAFYREASPGTSVFIATGSVAARDRRDPQVSDEE